MRPPHSFAQKFVHGSILGQFWSGATQSIGLLNSFLVLTALSVYQFGLYQLILAAIAIAAAFSTEFFDNVVVNDISRFLSGGEKSEAKRLFIELAAVKIALGLLVAAAIFFGASLIAQAYGRDIAVFIRLSSTLILLRAVRSAGVKFLGAVVSLRAMGATAVEEFSKLVAIAGFLFFSKLGIGEVLLASILGALASAVFIIIPFLKEYSAVLTGVAAEKRFILPGILKLYGLWIIVRHAVANTARNITTWIIGVMLNAEAVALYVLATNLRAIILQILPFNIGNLLAWEAEYPERMHYIFTRSMKYAFWSGTIVAFLSILIVPLGIKLALPKYVPAIPLFSALVFAIPLIGMSRVQQGVLMALREQELLTARTFTAVIADVLLLIVSIPIFGLFALVVEQFFSYIFRLIFYQVNLVKKYRHLKLRSRDFFTFDREDRIIFLRGLKEMRSFLRERLHL